MSTAFGEGIRLVVKNTFIDYCEISPGDSDGSCGASPQQPRARPRAGSDPLSLSPKVASAAPFAVWTPRPQTFRIASGWARPPSEEAEGQDGSVKTLRLEVQASEEAAKRLTQEYRQAEDNVAALSMEGCGSRLPFLQNEEQELREKLSAVQQDLQDTYDTQAVLKERQQGVAQALAHQLQVQGLQLACSVQENAGWEQELEAAALARSQEQAALLQAATEQQKGQVAMPASVRPGTMEVVAQESHTKALLCLERARHAAAVAQNRCEQARRACEEAKSACHAQQRCAAAALGQSRATVLAEMGPRIQATEQKLREAAAKHGETLGRSGTWQVLCQSSKARAEVCQETLRKTEQHAEHFATTTAELRDKLEALGSRLSAAAEASSMEAWSTSHCQQRRQAAFALLVLALGVTLARIGHLLSNA